MTTREEYDAAKAATATARAEIAELRGEGVGVIMGMAGDPALLKSCAEIIKSRGLKTTPQAYLRTMLEKRKDDFLDANKSDAPASTSTLNAPSAAVAAYRAKLANGSA